MALNQSFLNRINKISKNKNNILIITFKKIKAMIIRSMIETKINRSLKSNINK